MDISAIYYTANRISDHFAENTQRHLLEAIGEIPLITVSQQPMHFGHNITVDFEPSHFNIYRQALIGAKEATTKYIALCEDDVLYSPEHFKYRPKGRKFAYNLGAWSIYTWGDPMFSHKGTVRKNLNSLICDRKLFIEAMEERFTRYPNDEADAGLWAEPSKYERQLGVTVRESEVFYTNPPNIIFSHQTELSFSGLGTRKRLGEFRAITIPHWGSASGIIELYR